MLQGPFHCEANGRSISRSAVQKSVTLERMEPLGQDQTQRDKVLNGDMCREYVSSVLYDLTHSCRLAGLCGEVAIVILVYGDEALRPAPAGK